MKVKGIIFDFDGVIVDSEPYWEIADRVIVRQEGKNFLPEAKLQIMGLSPIESIRILCNMHNIMTSPEQMLARREELMKKFYDNIIDLNYGAYELLEYLYDKGIKIALASSTPYKLFAKALKRLKIDKFFSCIVTAEDIIKSKPDPEIFLKTQRFMNLNREELIIVEDSRAGVQGAKNAGIKVIWLKNVNAKIGDLFPDYTITTLSEIRLFFEQDY